MTTKLPPDVLQDDIAVSLARAIAASNKRAHELGVDVSQSLISISQQAAKGGSVWQINYGPKDYVGQRGGDLMVEVDTSDSSIKRVLWGQ
jgi:hypothetical protein